MRSRLLLTALLLLPLLTACAGQPCDELAALQAERDERRQQYADLVAPGTAPGDVTAQADEELHAFERRVYDLEQQCEDA